MSRHAEICDDNVHIMSGDYCSNTVQADLVIYRWMYPQLSEEKGSSDMFLHGACPPGTLFRVQHPVVTIRAEACDTAIYPG